MDRFDEMILTEKIVHLFAVDANVQMKYVSWTGHSENL